MGELNVYVTYDVSVHSFIIYCENMDLLVQGSFTYTVTAYLTAYPNVPSCTTSTTAIIVIINPCLTC